MKVFRICKMNQKVLGEAVKNRIRKKKRKEDKREKKGEDKE